MAYVPMYQTTISSVRPHPSDKDLQHLLAVAKVMKVETFNSQHADPVRFDVQDFVQAMLLKMESQPKWDSKLSADGLTTIKQHSELLSRSFGVKSYGHAWFLKQRGKSDEAKSVLQDLFKSMVTNVMQMDSQPFRGSPLSKIELISVALKSLSRPAEMEAIDSELQKVKIHFSNLPPSNIQT